MKRVIGINTRRRGNEADNLSRRSEEVDPIEDANPSASLPRRRRVGAFFIVLVFAQCFCLTTMGDTASEADVAEKIRILKTTKVPKTAGEGLALLDAVKGLRSIGEPATPALLDVLKDPDASVRRNAVWVFEQSNWWNKDETVISALASAYNDTNAYVRSRVVIALGNSRANMRAVILCLGAALKDADTEVRRSATKSLEHFSLGRDFPDVKSAVPALVAALNDPDHEVCVGAAMVLWELEQSIVPAVPGLAAALKDKNAETRKHAVQLLGTIGPQAKAAVPALITAINGEDESLGIQACWALAAIGPDARAAIPSLLAALETRPFEDDLIRALAAIDPEGKASLPTLVAMGLPALRVMAGEEWLKKMGEKAVPALMAGLMNTNAQVRAEAAEALAEIGPDAKAARPLLVALLKDTTRVDPSTDQDVRASAKRALANIDVQFAVVSASEGLTDKDEANRDGALGVLLNIGPDALPKLLDVWGSKGSDRELRKKVSETVYLILSDLDKHNAFEVEMDRPTRKIGSALDSYVPVLIRSLSEEDPALRLNAVVVLKHIGPGAKSAVTSLVARLKDSDFVIRFNAAQALGAIGPGASAAISSLIECLGSEKDDEVRSHLAHALGEFRAKDAVPALIKALKNGDGKVCVETALALGAIGADASAGIAPLTARLKDYDEECRTNAVEALGLIAASLKERVDVAEIPALQEALQAMEEANFPPKFLAYVRGPLESLKAAAASGRGPTPAQEDIDRCWNLVVQVSGELDGEPVLGSGIIFGVANDRLYVVTAKHLVRRGTAKIVGLKAGIKSLPGESLDAELAEHSSSEFDVAVVVVRDVQKYKIPMEAIPFDRLGKPQSLQAKERVYALGLPIARKDESLQADEFVETAVSKVLFRSQTVRPGYSGGALFNSNWQLVGMIRADDPPFAHALTIDQVLAQVKEWGYPVNLKPHTP